jgi:hypothetical protein
MGACRKPICVRGVNAGKLKRCLTDVDLGIGQQSDRVQ